MSSTEIVRSDGRTPSTSDFLTQAEAAKFALSNLEDVEDIVELRNRFAAAQEYFDDVREQRENYFAAAEARLYAERRIGELRLRIPRNRAGRSFFDHSEAKRMREAGATLTELARHFGVNVSSIKRAQARGWTGEKPVTQSDREALAALDAASGLKHANRLLVEQLAMLPEGKFAALVQEAKERDLGLSLSGFTKWVLHKRPTRIEHGIYRLADGRLMIRWKADGQNFTRTLKTTSVDAARRHRLQKIGRLTSRHLRSGETLPHAFEAAVRLGKTLEKALARVGPDARRHVNLAFESLHAIEDELQAASYAEAKTMPRNNG